MSNSNLPPGLTWVVLVWWIIIALTAVVSGKRECFMS